jgi:hypothetical protein
MKMAFFSCCYISNQVPVSLNSSMVIFCESVSFTLSIVYILIKLSLWSWSFFHLKAKKKRAEILVEQASDLDLEQLNQRTQQLWSLSLPFLPEEGRRSSFRNVVILLKH